MRRAIMITGFNNWGKTTHIKYLFGRNNFFKAKTYSINGIRADFIVVPYSNDDITGERYIKFLKKYPDIRKKDLFGAFCPTREFKNDSLRILTVSSLSYYDEVHLFYLKFKWDHHAELMIEEIKQYLQEVQNLRHFIINADNGMADNKDRFLARQSQIRDRLSQLYHNEK